MENGGRTLPAVIAACSLATIVISAISPVRAADSSAWSRDSHSAFRLIAGSNAAGATALRAGIEIKLDPGWHTYWRYPGDSGVPPRFDFSQSDNLSAATVLYPVPHLYSDETGNTLGYKDAVIFPVRVVPKETDKPVTARLKFEYAVCEKVCVPVEGMAELALTAGASALDAPLKAAEARVPKAVSAAQAGLTLHRTPGGAKPMVTVDLDAPAGANVALFVEGPTSDWALPIPQPLPAADANHRRFSFALDGLPPRVNPNAPVDLIFTIVEGSRALEVRTHLD